METLISTKIIAVEGQDEVNFFKALLRTLGINNVQILNFEGKTKFKNKIKALKNRPGFENVAKIAFIRDSDSLPANAAFDSIVNALKSADLPFPDNINSFKDSNPNVGIFIMPNNDDLGMLEDLCLKSIEEEPVTLCIDEYFECIEENPNELSKAKVLCYLASKTPLVNSLGRAAVKGHWDFNSNHFNEIKTFIGNFS